MNHSQQLGTEPVGKLLRQQSIPASIGILVMSIYMIVDTIFVGRYVGPLAIGAITVVLPISFLISSIGMSIGVGGGSVISRALGAGDDEHALHTFSNQISLTLSLALIFVVLGYFAMDPVLNLFGGKGELLAPSQDYFTIILLGVPFLAWAMMSNNVIRAEGAPRMAMLVLLIPAVVNMILDPIFIIVLDWGLKGAAWATTISYMVSATYSAIFFFSKKSELHPRLRYLLPNWTIVKEIASIGFVSLARQGSVSLLTIVLNNSLFSYGGEFAVSVYGVINRVMLFANFPVFGITQGFVPIVGYNYGAQKWKRVRESIRLSIRAATLIATIIFIGIMVFTPQLVQLFTTDEKVIAQTVPAMRWVFGATPLIAINLIGSGYFQAIGKVYPALFLTLSKQGFFLIPLVLLFPLMFGLDGIWYAFPVADVGAVVVTWFVLQKALKRDFSPTENEAEGESPVPNDESPSDIPAAAQSPAARH